MRFLADENFPSVAVAAFADAGHDIVWVHTAARGIADAEILDWAARDGRVLLTFDKDFGELARRRELPTACGVVLFRIPLPPPSQVGRHLLDLIASREDWAGHFSVVEPDRVRLRRFPLR